jgi:hypothetical protein
MPSYDLDAIFAYNGSLASLTSGDLIDTNLLNSGSSESGTIQDDDGTLDSSDSGNSTVFIDGGGSGTINYLGTGDIYTIGLLGIQVDPRPVTVFEIGGQIYFQTPDGLPLLSDASFGISIDANASFDLGPEIVVPCFTPGAFVHTPAGRVPVERLQAGDTVITRDNGMQKIRWIGKRTLSPGQLRANPHLRPVCIAAGSLGDGVPSRDMIVSPQHRFLLTHGMFELYFGEPEVFLASKHLLGHQGIQISPLPQVTYIHFMFDHHQVVLVDDAWTESFQPEDMTLNGMLKEQRDELLEIFPELQKNCGNETYTAARMTLKKREVSFAVSVRREPSSRVEDAGLSPALFRA